MKFSTYFMIFSQFVRKVLNVLKWDVQEVSKKNHFFCFSYRKHLVYHYFHLKTPLKESREKYLNPFFLSKLFHKISFSLLYIVKIITSLNWRSIIVKSLSNTTLTVTFLINLSYLLSNRQILSSLKQNNILN